MWRQQISKLDDQLVGVTERATQLALYFSEDEKNFSLHHCFVTLHDFLGIVEKTRKVSEVATLYITSWYISIVALPVDSIYFYTTLQILTDMDCFPVP